MHMPTALLLGILQRLGIPRLTNRTTSQDFSPRNCEIYQRMRTSGGRGQTRLRLGPRRRKETSGNRQQSDKSHSHPERMHTHLSPIFLARFPPELSLTDKLRTPTPLVFHRSQKWRTDDKASFREKAVFWATIFIQPSLRQKRCCHPS